MPRLVQYTLQPVTAADCTSGAVVRGGDVLPAPLMATYTFEIKDENGLVRETHSTSELLTSAQRTSLINLVTAVGVPKCNTEKTL